MPNPLENKHIMLGVSGSIAAYKAAELASRLTQQGAQVSTLLTEAAMEFVTPLTFQSVSGQKAYTEADLWGGEGHVVHVQIGQSTDLLIIAPASANTIAKLAAGIADNLLTVTALAATCPLIIAPAMDAGMYSHPATQQNIEILKERGAQFIGPAEGHLASGLVGPGRMEEPMKIAALARWLLSRSGPLAGKKVIITAGGTREALDPARFLSNYSSGKQGYALAQSALDQGCEVVLISAPTALEAPPGCEFVLVESAREMQEAVMAYLEGTDALVMAAAVADFRPARQEGEKIKKDQAPGTLKLEATEDILKTVAQYKKEHDLDLKIIGFAAESQELRENAVRKLREKSMDMIVANDISDPQAGFAVDTNKVLLMYSDGSQEQLPLMHKSLVAEKIIQHLASWLTEGGN